MKKTILLLGLSLATSFTFAQKENVKKAKKLASKGTPQFEEAKSLIDAALKNETTKDQAYTWYVKGLIYSKMFDFEDEKRFEVPPQKPDVNIQSESAYSALKAWEVADSLDIVESKTDPKRKGKIEYRKDITKDLIKMKNYINNYGNILFEKQDYAGAISVFEDFVAFPNMEMFKEESKLDKNDSIYIFAKQNIEIALKQLYVKQTKANDTTAFLATLDKGMELFPSSKFFIEYRINYDIHTGNVDNAIAQINKAISVDPNNAAYYRTRGYIYKAIKKRQEAKDDFLKALELKPDYYDALFDYGLFLKEIADDMYDKASFASSTAAAEQAMIAVNKQYDEALVYLEKAKAIDAKDDVLLQTMQGLYRKLKMYDKEKAIRAERGL